MCSWKSSLSLQVSPNRKKWDRLRTGNGLLSKRKLQLANLKESPKPCNSEVDFDFDAAPAPVGLAGTAAP